jgi:hypothetical protein
MSNLQFEHSPDQGKRADFWPFSATSTEKQPYLVQIALNCPALSVCMNRGWHRP